MMLPKKNIYRVFDSVCVHTIGRFKDIWELSISVSKVQANYLLSLMPNQTKILQYVCIFFVDLSSKKVVTFPICCMSLSVRMLGESPMFWSFTPQKNNRFSHGLDQDRDLPPMQPIKQVAIISSWPCAPLGSEENDTLVLKLFTIITNLDMIAGRKKIWKDPKHSKFFINNGEMEDVIN